jgi:phage-related protein
VAYSAGTAYLEVVPSFLNVEALIAKAARKLTQGLDKQLGKQLTEVMNKGSQDADRAAGKAGDALGKTFSASAIRRVESALKNIPETDRILKPLRKELQEISQIDLGKGFDERDFIARVEKAYAALRKAQQDAQGINAVGRYTNAGNAAQELGAVKDIIEQARKRGFLAGDAFSDAYLNRLKAMDRILPDLKITAKSSQEERAVAALKARIAEATKLQIGDVATRDNNPLNLRIGAKISGDDVKREMEQIEALLDQFTERFSASELVFPLDKARQQAAAFFKDIQTQQERADEKSAAEFLELWEAARAENARRDKAARERDRADFDRLWQAAHAENYKREKAARDKAKADEARRQEELEKAYEQYLAQLNSLDDRNRSQRLRQQRAELEQRARELRQSRDRELAEERRHQQALDRLHEQAFREDQKRREDAAKAIEREQERAFRQTTQGQIRQNLGRASDRIVDLPVHLRANDIDREMAAIRDRIGKLGDIRIGLDLDAESFADEVSREFRRLEQIAQDRRVDIEVRADAAKAATELGAILVLLNRIDGEQAEIKVDADGATSGALAFASSMSLSLGRLGALIATGASLGTAIVPAAAAAASAIGAIGTAALAAGSGIGVLMLAFSGIGEAVGAMGKLADNQAKSNASLSRSASQIAAAQDQIRSAEAALANTRRNNANAAEKAQRNIKEALEDQRDAVQDVARANQDAIERVRDAQRDVVTSTREEQSARERLNEAYAQARRELEDLRASLRGNALDQRQATLDIAEAKKQLDKVMANPRATEAEREQADITYHRRLLQMDEVRRKGGELADEQAKQFRDGIDQSKQVKAAREDIARAEQRRLDAQRSLTKAQEDLVRTQLDGSRKLRDAEQKVMDSRAAAAEQQRDAAYAEFQATQAVVAARRALANATDRSALAGGAQLDNLQSAMAKLSPTAQAFARYIFGLRDAFYALRGAADPVLAGLQRAMTSLIGANSDEAQKKLAPLFDFVNRVATAIGGMFERFAQLLQGPTFSRFFAYISDTAVPTLWLMYEMFENITVGLVNLFLAFTPLTDSVNQGFLGMTESFRKWSEGLSANAGFQSFMAYLRENGPLIADLLGEMIKAFVHLVIAAAPIGTIVIKILTQLFEWINKIPQDTLTALVAGIAAGAAAIAAIAGATALAALKIPGLIALILGGLVVAFAALGTNSKTVREALGTVWDAIQVGAAAAFAFLKQAIVTLRPVFDNMVEAARAFWQDGLVPVFNAVKALFVSLYEGLRPSFGNIRGALSQLGVFFFQLYDGFVLPAFKGIMAVARVLFEVLEPVFSVIGSLLGALGTIFFWLLNKVVMPVINGIVRLLSVVLRPVIEFLWKFILKPILQALGLAFQVAAAIIKVAIGLILIALKALGMLFAAVYNEWIKPIWDKLVKNVFRPMADWITKHIKPHWDKAIDGLAKKWSELSKIFGAVTKIVIKYALNEGLLKGYNWLADKFNISPKNVKIPEPTGDWYTKSAFAAGGAVYGPGPKGRDSVRAVLAPGEHVLTAKEVDAAGGQSAIYAWRRELVRQRGHQHFARGGAVGRRGTGDGFGDWLKNTGKRIGKKATDVFEGVEDFLRNPVKSLADLAKGLLDKVPAKDTWFVQRLMTIPNKIVDALKTKVTGLFSGGDQDGQMSGARAGGSSLGGSLGMINILRQAFPGLPLNSGYRPGSITVTGNRSYHGQNRAIDTSPRSDVFEWIRNNYPNSRELIFSPKGSRQIHNGRPHVYSGAVKRTHYDHVHWAYEQGGLLPDTRNMPGGVMQVFHGRRTPDKVLTDTQWQTMSRLANRAQMAMAGGDTWNFEFRDTTLDEGKLAAIQARRDALNRVNRSNY